MEETSKITSTTQWYRCATNDGQGPIPDKVIEQSAFRVLLDAMLYGSPADRADPQFPMHVLGIV
jgi:hypothetical protein